MTFALRALRDADGPALIDLIGTIWREYTDQGVVFDPAELPELTALASHLAGRGGTGWVAAGEDGRLRGVLGILPAASGRAELVKVYVAAASRGQGTGRALVSAGEAWARSRGVTLIELWTDTRFTLAHAFYHRLGYQATGRSRDLNDLSHTTEWQFEKALA